MRMFLKGAAIALALAGTALLTAGTADAQGSYNNGYRHNDSPVISIGFGNVAFGFNDGYWDNNHRWHHWRNQRDHRNYRDQNRNNYHDWRHDRDSDNGWQRH
jgi:uncharacterized protein YraI